MTTTTTDGQDFPGVLTTLKAYYDGLYHLDVDRLRQVFSPKARYATASGGELLELSIEDYFKRLAQRTAPASVHTPYGYTVHSIAFAGPVTAFAEVRCSLFDHDYIDFLTLLRLDGEWRIQSKVFHGTPVPQTELHQTEAS
ncbi:MAG: nuclear transport factor 2 family protein [Planctomycetota bacterium]